MARHSPSRNGLNTDKCPDIWVIAGVAVPGDVEAVGESAAAAVDGQVVLVVVPIGPPNCQIGLHWITSREPIPE